jgi:hypothetical protein
MVRSERFIVDFTGGIDNHEWDAITNRIGESSGTADQLLGFSVVL